MKKYIFILGLIFSQSVFSLQAQENIAADKTVIAKNDSQIAAYEKKISELENQLRKIESTRIRTVNFTDRNIRKTRAVFVFESSRFGNILGVIKSEGLGPIQILTEHKKEHVLDFSKLTPGT